MRSEETAGELVFFDRDHALVECLSDRGYRTALTDDPVNDLSFDWIVSPANCIGYMDGGFDLYLAKSFDIDPVTGWRPYFDDGPIDMQETFFDPGEVIEWEEPGILIATTVMKPVSRTKRPANHEHIKSCLRGIDEFAESNGATVACPGLGTGFGGVTPREFADMVDETVGGSSE